MTRLAAAVLVVWACSCGIQGRVSWWVAMQLPQAQAAIPSAAKPRIVKLYGSPVVIPRLYGGVLFVCNVWGTPVRFLEECAVSPVQPKRAVKPHSGSRLSA